MGAEKENNKRKVNIERFTWRSTITYLESDILTLSRDFLGWKTLFKYWDDVCTWDSRPILPPWGEDSELMIIMYMGFQATLFLLIYGGSYSTDRSEFPGECLSSLFILRAVEQYRTFQFVRTRSSHSVWFVKTVSSVRCVSEKVCCLKENQCVTWRKKYFCRKIRTPYH